MSKGFGTVTKTPKQEIRNMRSNVKALSPSNIGVTVASMRASWDADYPHRLHKNLHCS